PRLVGQRKFSRRVVSAGSHVSGEAWCLDSRKYSRNSSSRAAAGGATAGGNSGVGRRKGSVPARAIAATPCQSRVFRVPPDYGSHWPVARKLRSGWHLANEGRR